jgi:hypothetical protein
VGSMTSISSAFSVALFAASEFGFWKGVLTCSIEGTHHTLPIFSAFQNA